MARWFGKVLARCASVPTRSSPSTGPWRRCAPPNLWPAVSYLAAGAEQIPLRDTTVDLSTVGAAFHWFDQPRAFATSAKVARWGHQSSSSG